MVANPLSRKRPGRGSVHIWAGKRQPMVANRSKRIVIGGGVPLLTKITSSRGLMQVGVFSALAKMSRPRSPLNPGRMALRRLLGVNRSF